MRRVENERKCEWKGKSALFVIAAEPDKISNLIKLQNQDIINCQLL